MMKLYPKKQSIRVLCLLMVLMLAVSLTFSTLAIDIDEDASLQSGSSQNTPDNPADPTDSTDPTDPIISDDTAEQPQILIEPLVLPFSLDVREVASFTELEDAINDATVTTIILTDDITQDHAFTVAGARELTITSADGEYYTLTQCSFAFEAGSQITIQNVCIDGGGNRRGIMQSTVGTAAVLTLENVTFQNCFTYGADAGGAVKVTGVSGQDAATLTIKDCVFKSNRAPYGGGLAVFDASATITGTTLFQGNATTSGDGGAVLVQNGELTVSGDVRFEGNVGNGTGPLGGAISGGTANSRINLGGSVVFDGNSAKYGGAIFMRGPLTITGGVRFSNNNASQEGGAIYVNGTTAAITGDVVFDQNTAGQNGGAICTRQTSGKIEIGTDSASNVQFLKNNAASGWGGGAIYAWTGEVTVGAGTLFDGNKSSALSGAGIYARAAQLTITGTAQHPVVFQNGNAASCGGAICMIEGVTGNVEYANFLNNRARNFGGAIDIDGSTTSNTVTLKNCDFVGNICTSTGGAVAVEVGTNTLTVERCLFERNSAGGEPHSFYYRNANGNGGGIYFEKGTLHVMDSKFINNTTPKSGGGIGMNNSYSNMDTFLRSITVSGTEFYGNGANAFYNLTNPTYLTLHDTNINPGEGGRTYSLDYAYAYNNYDISYTDSDGPTTRDVTVTFDTGGGTPVPDPVTFPAGHGVVKPSPDPVKPGHTFLNWVTEDGNLWAFATAGSESTSGAPVTRDMTLYAKYQANEYYVTYHSNFDSDTTYLDIVNASAGPGYLALTYAHTGLAFRSGYTFDGWSKSATGNVDYAETTAIFLNDNLDLYAVWKKNGGGVTQPVTTSVTVTKNWMPTNMDHPSSATVQLLRDGVPYGQAVVLDAQNSWTYKWDDLDGNNTWSVQEESIPSDYVVNITGRNGDYIMTNTYRPGGPGLEEINVVMKAHKLLNNSPPPAGTFWFTLYDDSGAVWQKVSNDGSGSVTFNGLTFNRSGTYLYRIAEAAGTVSAMVYDKTVYEAQIVVTQNGNALNAQVSYYALDDTGNRVGDPKDIPTFYNTIGDDAGGFVELDEDGTPLGKWVPNDEGNWEFIPDEEPPLTGSVIPQTGDDAPLGMLIGLALTSLAGVIFLLPRKKRAQE